MHVRVRLLGKPETIVVVESKLTKIEKFRDILHDKFGLAPDIQRLFYGGKLLEDGYTFHDYNIKFNDVIQVMEQLRVNKKSEDDQNNSVKKDVIEVKYKDAESKLYSVGDLIDIIDPVHGSWNEGKIVQIVTDTCTITSEFKEQNIEIDNALNSDNNVENEPPNINTETSESEADIPDKQVKKINIDNSESEWDIPETQPSEINSDNSESELDIAENPSPRINRDNSESDLDIAESPSPKINRDNSESELDIAENPSPKINSDNSESELDIAENPSPKINSDNSESELDIAENPSPKINRDNSESELDIAENPSPKINRDNSESELDIAENPSPKINRDNSESELNTTEILGAQIHQIDKVDENLLYKVQFEGDEEDSNLYCKLSEIRPRARTVIDVKDLKIGQKVMLNYNIDDSSEVGYWYDFKISAIEQRRVRYKGYRLVGTLYFGPQALPQDDTNISVRDKIYAIEEVVPLNQRTDEYIKLMRTPTEKRSVPFDCHSCRDNDDAKCRECGCFVCGGKEFPEKIILCDECNHGFHMHCVRPPLEVLPEGDWYCPYCKTDPNEVVAPGGSKQKKKDTKSKRDWGRGMACVGKSKTCLMPANHFGPIPGVDVGMRWRFRIQLSESGVHRPPVSGIHGRDHDGAYSLVLSGGYEDDKDDGYEFTYTGSGGRDLSGNKRTAGQSYDQTLTRENKALARNCAVKKITEAGADAGINWRDGKPVRVVRSYKMLKHFPKYAPEEGIRYDGIYKVVKYYPEKGLSGFRVWKYLLRRDDPTPAPWEPGAMQFPIIYPDGYLEAEAERKRRRCPNYAPEREKRSRPTCSKRSIEMDRERVTTPPTKKHKANDKSVTKRKGPKPKKIISPNYQRPITEFFTKSPPNTSTKSVIGILSSQELAAITADKVNIKPWEECLEICKTHGKTAFLEHVTQMFLCIICQELAAGPVTTPCLHNFCMACLLGAFKSTNTKFCPCCRYDLSKFVPNCNSELQVAIRSVLPGYDAGRLSARYIWLKTG